MTYYSKHLYPFVCKVIRDKKSYVEGYCVSVDELSESELFQFARHLILDSDSDLYCIYDNEKYQDIVMALFQMLNHSTTDNKISFSEILMDKIVEFYRPKMQSIIEEIQGWAQHEDRAWDGLTQHVDKINGELSWSKS